MVPYSAAAVGLGHELELVKNDAKFYEITNGTVKDRVVKQVRAWWRVGVNVPYFPGPQPVSIERKHLSVLRRDEYWVCAKSDGTRYVMVLMRMNGEPLAMLVSRSMSLLLLRVTSLPDAFEGTVMDGELVETRSTGATRFLVYDAVMVSGGYVGDQPHSERMHAARCLLDYTTCNQMTVRPKLFYPMRQIAEYMEREVPRLDHATDGFVFTPEALSVTTGTHFSLFKWKPRLANTVDFHVQWYGRRRRFVLSVGHKKQTGSGFGLYEIDKARLLCAPEAEADLVGERGSSADKPQPRPQLPVLSKTDPQIVECRYVSPNRWVPVTVRTDKTYPNNWLTYTKTMLNIDEDIQLREFDDKLY
eukprot:9503635-Pyramimonas_sp.AAC.2